jgi:hypothetical protein
MHTPLPPVTESPAVRVPSSYFPPVAATLLPVLDAAAALNIENGTAVQITCQGCGDRVEDQLTTDGDATGAGRCAGYRSSRT